MQQQPSRPLAHANNLCFCDAHWLVAVQHADAQDCCHLGPAKFSSSSSNWLCTCMLHISILKLAYKDGVNAQGAHVAHQLHVLHRDPVPRAKEGQDQVPLAL